MTMKATTTPFLLVMALLVLLSSVFFTVAGQHQMAVNNPHLQTAVNNPRHDGWPEEPDAPVVQARRVHLLRRVLCGGAR
jgi:hypothetical protein